MKVAIIGNGPCRELYNESLGFDKVVGTNLPPENIKIDYVACADAKAVGLMYRPWEGPHYHRLKNNEFQLVLGTRANHGLKTSKSEPGGVLTTQEFLKKNNHIYKVIELFPSAKEIGQRYFSSGHYAFLFANEEWPNSDIHMFGFDSFFTGNNETHSVKIHKPEHNGEIKRKGGKHNNNSPINTVGSWYWVWERLFNSDKNKAASINIHGYKDDTIPNSFKDIIKVVNHEVLPRV